jgi:pimeloyl-ACP methyl ester carboxylesterase
VTRVAALVSMAPGDADLDWYADMGEGNVRSFRSIDDDPVALRERLNRTATRTSADPLTLVEELRPQLAVADHSVIEDVAFRQLLTVSYRDALQSGPSGWIDDTLALRRPWHFKLQDIKVPVLLWHGQDDTFAPVGHTHWIATQLVNAPVKVHIEQGAAHFGAMEVLPEVLAWATTDD